MTVSEPTPGLRTDNAARLPTFRVTEHQIKTLMDFGVSPDELDDLAYDDAEEWIIELEQSGVPD